MKAQDVLADTVLASRDLLSRFLDGFTDENRTRQAPHLPNHVGWTLGHLAFTLNRAAAHIDGNPLPASDFTEEDGQTGGRERYTAAEIRIGSEPVDDPGRYPSLARGRAIFEAGCVRLASAVRQANARTLNRQVDWGTQKLSLWALVNRVIFHNGMHAGQVVDLRRALGMERIIKLPMPSANSSRDR
jgi:hypothetical protein